VAVKTERQQGAALVFRTCDMLVKQRIDLGIASSGAFRQRWLGGTQRSVAAPRRPSSRRPHAAGLKMIVCARAGIRT
jgi:hypothetical protein